MTSDIERVMPNDILAEQSVLGACLIDRKAVEVALEALKVGHFHWPKHRAIFAAIERVYQDSPVDIVTVSNALRDMGTFDDIGMGYLADLQNSVPSTFNVRHYADIVYAKAWRRGAIGAAEQTMDWAYDADLTLPELMSRIDRRFDTLSNAAGQSVSTTEELLDEAAEYLMTGRSVRIPCGIETLDEYQGGGMLPGFFTLIGADPGYGKTRHLTKVTHNLLRAGKGVAFLSLEIPRQEIMAELLALEIGVNRDVLGDGSSDSFDITPTDPRYIEARKRMADYKLCLHSEPIDADEVEPLVRRMVRDRGVSVLNVDYAGLIGVRGSVGPERMEHVSQCLAETYKRLKLAGIVLCHVTKKDGQITPWYSRKLDQDCQSFFYIVPTEGNALEREEYEWKNIKNRYARQSRNTLKLGWNLEYGHFEDLPQGKRRVF